MKYISFKKIVAALVLILALPGVVSASTISASSNDQEFSVGDNVVINVLVNSEGKNINAIDGAVTLDYPAGTVVVKDLSVAGSPFTLWPRKPSLSDDGKTISFVGGVPGFVNSKELTAFKIVLELDKEGKVTVTPSKTSVYLSDGKGTADTVHTSALTFTVSPKKSGSTPRNEWNDVVAKDQVPPEPFDIQLGQSATEFNGQKFLTFNAVDNQSGIAYYEVKEGNLAPVRSGATYILQEQNKDNSVIVTAYDVAHNARQSVYNPVGKKGSSSLPAIVTVLVIIILGIFIFRKKWRK